MDEEGRRIGHAGFIQDLDEIKRWETRLEALLETAKAVTSTRDLHEILEIVIRSALNAIPAADRGSIHFYDPEKQELILQISSYEDAKRELQELRFKKENGIAGWVYENQAAVNSGQVIIDPRYIPADHPEVRHASLLCVPVTGKREKVGVMSVSHSTTTHAFSDCDRYVLQNFADHAAIAIENAHQFLNARQEADELEILRNISLKINRQENVADILNILLESGNKLLGSEMAVVHWRGRSEAKIRTFTAPKELQSLSSSPRPEGGLTTEIFTNGEIITIPDTNRDERVNQPVKDVGIRSLIGCPLKLGDRVAGALFFNSRQVQHFQEHEVQLISRLLPIAAVAVENSDSIERHKRNKNLSESLMQVSSRLASTHQLEDQIAALRQFVLEELNAPMFYLGLYDEARDLIHFPLSFDEKLDLNLPDIHLKSRKEYSLSGYVVKKRQPILWFNEKEKREACQKLRIDPVKLGTGCQTCLAFPLEVEEKILGVFSIQSHRPDAWDEIETSTFQTLANQASIAIRNTKLVEEINSSFGRLFETYLAGEKVIAELDPVKALDTLVSHMCSTFRAYRANAVLISEQGKPYHIATSGFPQKLDLETAIREEGISVQVFRTQKAEFFSDLTAATAPVHPGMAEQNVLAAACLPLVHNNRPLGVLWIHYDQPQKFPEKEKEAMRLLTELAAIAFENARLHQQVNKARDTAKTVAKATTLGDLDQTLVSIVRGVGEVLGCDIVTLWTYHQGTNEFDPRPATFGHLDRPHELTRTGLVDSNATPFKIIGMDKPYIAEDTLKDPILGSPFAKREGVCSSMAVPLHTHARRVGVLFINYRQKHNFSQDEQTNIALFSDQAAIAMSNAMTYADEKKRREVLKIIDEAGRTVTATLELKEIFKKLAAYAYQLSGQKGKPALFASINLVEDNTTNVREVFPPAAEADILQENMKNVHLDGGIGGRIGIVGKAAKERRPLLIPDVRDYPDYLCANPDTRCELAVPIVYRDEVVGVINVEHDQVRGLDQDDRHDIQMLAAHAAVAIQNARIYEALERKNTHQNALYDSSKIINASLERSEKELLDLLVEQMVTKIIPAGGAKMILGALHVYDQDKQELKLVSTYPQAAFENHQVGEVRSLIHPAGGKIGIAGRAVQRRELQLVGDVSRDEDYHQYSVHTKSELDVPLLEGDKVLGVLSLECNQCDGIDQEMAAVLSAFAELAVIALENTRRYQELKETRIMVGNITAVAWMGLVAGNWRHSIGNMATTISDLASLVKKDLEKGAPPEKINIRLEKIQGIVKEIQNIPMPPLSSESGIEKIYIIQLVRDRINQFKMKERFASIDFRLNVQIREGSSVRASPEWLRRILDILIDNAMNAMRDSTTKQLTVDFHRHNGGVEIFVTDTGTGIPAEVIPDLFVKPIKKREGERGSGIGLFIAHTVVQAYGGRLGIHATGPSGTTMALWLPLMD